MITLGLFKKPICKVCKRKLFQRYNGNYDGEIFDNDHLCDDCWVDFKYSPEYLLYKKRKLQLFIDSKLSS